MRWLSILVLALATPPLFGQAGWLPLSREVERPHALYLSRVGSDAHTAIRPYRSRDIQANTGLDSLRPTAALRLLDRWAGVRNGRKLRWGPLADASLGFDAGRDDAMRHKTGLGFWTDLDVGNTLTFHLDAQGWSQRFPDYLDTLVRATGTTPMEGFAYGNRPAYHHYDINGHVSWDPGKYFNFTVGRGRNSFGEGYRSLMLSSEAYGYPFLRITTSVWRIRYVNLFTAMSDIRGAGGDPARFWRKYTSMHYFSINIGKRANVGLFEAIVWQGGDDPYPRGFDFNYLNPVIFYRPVEFEIGSPDNALLGGSFSLKVGRHTLVYTQFMLDEFLLDQVRAGYGWYANKQAVQAGFIAREAMRIKGLDIRVEWNFVRPFMYTHSDTRQNYAHFGQPLAHPYGSNFQEVLLHAERTMDRWTYGLRTSMAWLGSDNAYSYGNNIFRPESDRPPTADNKPENFGYRVGRVELVQLFHAELRGGYLLDPNTGTRLEASYLFRARNPELADLATTNYFRVGVVCHFRDRGVEQEARYAFP